MDEKVVEKTDDVRGKGEEILSGNFLLIKWRKRFDLCIIAVPLSALHPFFIKIWLGLEGCLSNFLFFALFLSSCGLVKPENRTFLGKFILFSQGEVQLPTL